MARLLSLKEVAKEVGVSYPTIWRYCRELKDTELKDYLETRKQGKKTIYFARRAIIRKLRKMFEEGYRLYNKQSK